MTRDPGAVKVEGLRQTVNQLQTLGADVDDLKDTFSAIADEGARVMASLVPVRSGKLRATIHGNRAKSKAVVTVGRGSVPYAGPINYGWPARHIKARNFVAKTDQVMGPRIEKMLDQGLEKAIRKIN